MITPIKHDMESEFHTITKGNDVRYYVEIGCHAYPDPLYVGVISGVINNVSFLMEVRLHNDIKDILIINTATELHKIT
jgi:hypothetical protein